MRSPSIITFWCGFCSIFQLSSAFLSNYGKCERITISMCTDMKYNLTKMPNLLGHNNQKEAFVEFQTFLPLVQVNCSPLLKFFLCSLYAPMCTEQVEEVLVVPACRLVHISITRNQIIKVLNFHFFGKYYKWDL